MEFGVRLPELAHVGATFQLVGQDFLPLALECLEHVCGPGHVLDPVSGMRSGLTPEYYQEMLDKESDLKKKGSTERVAPDLEDFETKIYEDWKKTAPKKEKPVKIEVKVEEEKEEEKKEEPSKK